ncbi:MAG: FtsX-like permease family protein, partial [Chitinophagaceae bacterium]|nr:FtsX-like permease family protein [Chitinophagaceae bacterium]
MAAINLLCLSIGFCFTLVIGVYISQQKRVNQQFKNVAHQYILRSNWKSKDIGSAIASPAPFARALKDEYPNLVKNYYRYNPVTNVVSAGERSFKENIAIGDTNFVSMYGLPVLYGTPDRAFDNVNTAVVTASFAKKMFGTENAIGKTIAVQTVVENVKQDYSISAVIKDLPYNSVFNQGYFEGYTIFVPSVGNKYYGFGDPLTGWTNNSCVGMVELQDGVQPKDLVEPSKQLLAKYTPEFFQKNLTVEYAAVKDFYLHDNDNAVDRMVTTLSIISAFILLMAIFNFVNISTAAATYRVKEIGLRKVFGSRRIQIAAQFLIEACLLAVVSGFLALALYEITRSWFSRVLDVELISAWRLTAKQYIGFVALVTGIGFLAGIYPAFSIARYRTALSVKGRSQHAGAGLLFRRMVLTIQFSMAILVFIGAAIVNKQVSFIFNRDTGYNKDQLLVITAFPKRWDSVGVQKMEVIKQGLLQLPEVTSATLSFNLPDGSPVNTAINLLPVNGADRSVLVPV